MSWRPCAGLWGLVDLPRGRRSPVVRSIAYLIILALIASWVGYCGLRDKEVG